MLKSVTIGRARYHKPGSKFNGYYEDEVTSAVFGPLSYMGVGNTWRFIDKLICDRFEHDNWPKQQPGVIEINFWPALVYGKGERDKIPDLIIDLKEKINSQPIFRLIIEVKWQSGASKVEEGIPIQLQEQWTSSIKEIEPDRSVHIYLVLDESAARQEKEKIFHKSSNKLWSKFNFDRSEWEKRLHILTWAQLAMTLEDGQWPIKLKCWADDVVGFLDKLGVPRFTGFNNIGHLPLEKTRGKLLFWVDWEGFIKGIRPDQLILRQTPAPLFWEEPTKLK